MLKDFKPVLKIFLRFIVIYLVLLGIYQLYLNQQVGLDSYSVHVSNQCTRLQNAIGYESQMVPQPEYKTSWYYVSGDYVTRMVEGCNAVSIMIMFVAFIFAFYKGAKTFLFAGLGLVLLYVLNIIRIAGINIAAVEHPEYLKTLHDYAFPAVIYGGVVVLWLVWIKFFVINDEQRA